MMGAYKTFFACHKKNIILCLRPPAGWYIFPVMKANHIPVLTPLTEAQINGLQALRVKRGCTRMRLIREAIDAFLFPSLRPPAGGRNEEKPQ